MVICYYDFSNSTITMETFSSIIVCHYNLPRLVVTNSNALYPLETCHWYAIIQKLNAAILPSSICKPGAY